MLAKDVHGERFLFYQAVGGNQILYRKSSNGFAVEYTFETSDNELFPRGFRIHHTEVSPYHDICKHLMFYQEGNSEMPKYKMSSPADFYTVGLDLCVTDPRGRSIFGARVEINGQTHVTDTDGFVTFYKLPFGVNVEVELSHPTLGIGDTQSIFIPESAKGMHLSISLFFEIPKLHEYVEPCAGVAALKWQGTEYIEHLAEDELYLDANLGIEWEEVRSPEHHVQDSLELEATVDSEWVRIYRLYTYPEEELELSAEIKSILWVEV